MILLAVDPSITRTGYACFIDGLLVRVGVVLPSFGGSQLTRACNIAHLLRLEVAKAQHIAFEWPQIYSREKSKGDPNNILPLSAVCGAIGASYPNAELFEYKPREWLSGNIPKNETVKGCKKSPRATLISRCLSGQGEKLHWNTVKYHDEIDAIGIGLHHLGRLKRLRIMPGATPG